MSALPMSALPGGRPVRALPDLPRLGFLPVILPTESPMVIPVPVFSAGLRF